MLWTTIRSWAKDQGYKADRTKIDGDNSYHYTWFKIEDPSIAGEAASVSKVAKAIYNHITNDIHVEYQARYMELQSLQDIVYDEPSKW